MVYEIKYTTKQLSSLNEYCDDVRRAINLKKDCFVFYYIGNKFDQSFPSQLQCYQFIKSIEQRFNININWIDLHWVFDKLITQYDKSEFQLNQIQLQLLLDQFKVLYHISLDEYCRKVKPNETCNC